MISAQISTRFARSLTRCKPLAGKTEIRKLFRTAGDDMSEQGCFGDMTFVGSDIERGEGLTKFGAAAEGQRNWTPWTARYVRTSSAATPSHCRVGTVRPL